jgi:hypothetical protein
MKIIMELVLFVFVLLLPQLHFVDALPEKYTVSVSSAHEVPVNHQVQITADLTNNQQKEQPFAYLVQIQNEEGVTISLSWITGSLAPRQSMSPSQSWTPTEMGRYTAQIFVWESVDNPDALSVPLTITINVVETINT